MRTKGLETTLKMTYDFIDIPPHDANEHVSGDQIPYYINGDFTPLDKYYQPINGDVYALNNSNDFQDVFTKDIFPSTFKPQDKILVSFPNPKEYQNKEDFKQAFELWYKEASIYFSYVTLPIPISGEFYLPEPPKIFTKEEKAHPGRFRTFKPELWQLLPRNYLLMLTKLYQKDEIDPEELFPEQVPKRDPLCFKHHLTSQDQWCSSLVASEPNPILYDFYEEYEEAYVKWCNVTYDTLRSCPIPPKGMQTVATLDPIKDEEADIFEPSNPVLDTAFLSWANEIPPVTNLTNISEKIQNLNSLVRSKSKEFSTHGLRCSHVLYVFGIDKSKFISDSIAYGLYEPVTKSQTTIKPNVCVLGIPEKNIDKVQNLITTNQY
ncbi:hypothetical protein GPJ56_006761 [Histomonas meleagridis]|uniref:uncharacterized protein n=1 Tax=Histomonas meleagridis TaxID=135588 RepID=UPI003559AAEE|nr:hypothetical protein GPJ56_006761 [Histomonas meleagridis]KAH0802156.1 hypothetical protein GO595_005015 [Histomonas meleagridis]